MNLDGKFIPGTACTVLNVITNASAARSPKQKGCSPNYLLYEKHGMYRI